MLSIYTKPMDILRNLKKLFTDMRNEWPVYDGTTPSTPMYPYLTLSLIDCTSAIQNKAGFGDGYKPVVEIGIVAYKDGKIYDYVDGVCEILMNMHETHKYCKPNRISVRTGADGSDYIQYVVKAEFIV